MVVHAAGPGAVTDLIQRLGGLSTNPLYLPFDHPNYRFEEHVRVVYRDLFGDQPKNVARVAVARKHVEAAERAYNVSFQRELQAWNLLQAWKNARDQEEAHQHENMEHQRAVIQQEAKQARSNRLEQERSTTEDKKKEVEWRVVLLFACLVGVCVAMALYKSWSHFSLCDHIDKMGVAPVKFVPDRVWKYVWSGPTNSCYMAQTWVAVWAAIAIGVIFFVFPPAFRSIFFGGWVLSMVFSLVASDENQVLMTTIGGLAIFTLLACFFCWSLIEVEIGKPPQVKVT